ncbi:Membrane protein 2, distant similarity to thiosulphate:quinone oxidoreductase DoxD [plant metagenome]|uniref:Membrane protein 2, distant similarity to thiosulphate:quinone oxidoreductase DoxD n=1 Tax=plant metagenome TaxID=1297885 RepID=A0A484Q732_9ZZZZ
MSITKNDFAINASHFDVTQGWNLLRIATGVFFFPHAISKFAGDGGINPMVLGFFEAAGFSPAAAFVILAGLLEITVGVALVLGVCTRYAALVGAVILFTAVYALQTVTGFKSWVWNSGGYEYPVFWAIACLAVALEGFRQRRTAIASAVSQSA